MHLSRITIENFRNFSKLDATPAGYVVVVGENKVGKSYLMRSLGLLFDPSSSVCESPASEPESRLHPAICELQRCS